MVNNLNFVDTAEQPEYDRLRPLSYQSTYILLYSISKKNSEYVKTDIYSGISTSSYYSNFILIFSKYKCADKPIKKS